MTEQRSARKVWYSNNGVKGLDLSSLPRCQATATTTGQRCRRSAIKGTNFCGIHSGKYHPSAPFGNKRSFVHGRYSGQLRENMAKGKAVLQLMGRQIEDLLER